MVTKRRPGLLFSYILGILVLKQALAEITELAQDKKCWRGLTSHTEKAAEGSQTKN